MLGMRRQPLVSTNEAKLLLAWTDYRIAARLPLYGFFTVWADLVVQHLHELYGFFSDLSPVVDLVAVGGSMSFVSAPGAHDVAASIADDHRKHFIDPKHSLAIFSLHSLADLH